MNDEIFDITDYILEYKLPSCPFCNTPIQKDEQECIAHAHGHLVLTHVGCFLEFRKEYNV